MYVKMHEKKKKKADLANNYANTYKTVIAKKKKRITILLSYQ